MKKTCLVLATLTTLILMSCNYTDNSISSAEDVNYLQLNALKKEALQSQALEESNSGPTSTRGNGSMTRNPCTGTMSVSGLPFGSEAWSSEAVCDFTNIPQANPINRYYEYSNYSISMVGTVSVTKFKFRCGAKADSVAWNGWTMPITTTAFAGDPANVICYMSFKGKCVGTASGGGNCSHSRTGSAINYYSY